MKGLVFKHLVLCASLVLLVACGGGSSQQQPPTPAATPAPPVATPAPATVPATTIDTSAATPEAAYDSLAAAVKTGDIELFKALMSTGLAQRVSGDFLINQDLQKGRKYFEKVPKGEPTVKDGKAVFSSSPLDEGSVLATYSLEFVEEEGVWKFDGYRTSTKSK